MQKIEIWIDVVFVVLRYIERDFASTINLYNQNYNTMIVTIDVFIHNERKLIILNYIELFN